MKERQSTSAWGSELKYYFNEKDAKEECLPLREVVSWNGYRCRTETKWYLSTSAWGSELKYRCSVDIRKNRCLPLREVVSWNVVACTLLHFRFRLPLREVVSWNISGMFNLIPTVLSTSAWGSELKYYFNEKDAKEECLPLREVVSWNITSVSHNPGQPRLPLREVVSWNLLLFSCQT